MNNRANASADLSVANSISQIGGINAFDDIVFLDDGVELTSNSTEYADRTGLGLSIDAITNSYLDSIEIKDGSPIFDETFRLEKLSQASYGAVNTTETYSYATTNMQNMANNCSSSYGYSSSASWCNSIENRPSLIATSSDGLIPLWNLLPTEYDNETNRNKVKELYLDYAETKEIDYSKYNKAVLQNPNINQILIRSAEVTINDLGTFNNHADTVVFNNISKYGITVLQANGYTTANITLTLTMKEYNMGYQHILLYNGTSSNATLWAEKKLELGGRATQKNYITQSYDFQIPLSAFNVANPLIVVRYSASGAGPDQWLNKDLKVKITFS